MRAKRRDDTEKPLGEQELILRTAEEPSPDPILKELCYRHHLSITPYTMGRYRCGPVDYKNGDFGWYVVDDTPMRALANALERMEEIRGVQSEIRTGGG